MPWSVRVGGKIVAVIWSIPYKENSRIALEKWRELSGSEAQEPMALPMNCSADDCFDFATELLSGEGISDTVPKGSWFNTDVELNPGDKLLCNTISPLCEKHARRFRRSAQNRLCRIEERLDQLERAVEDLD